jgi:hypothetical protein
LADQLDANPAKVKPVAPLAPAVDWVAFWVVDWAVISGVVWVVTLVVDSAAALVPATTVMKMVKEE